MKLRRTSFLLAGSLLAATLLTSLGYSEPVLYQEPQSQSSDQEPTNKPLRPSPEVIAAWKKAGAAYIPNAFGEPYFLFTRRFPTEKLNVLPPPEVPFGLGIRNVTDAGLKELSGLTQLQSLSLRYTEVTDLGLKELSGLKQLRSLSLRSTKVTDLGLKELASLTQLQALNLYHTQVTDAGMKELSGLKQLQSLSLGYTKVTDLGLKELAGLKQLQSLNLDRTQVTDAGVQELQKALPKVRINH